MLKRLISAIAFCCVTPFVVSAQNTFTSPVEGEILSGWVQADGTRMAALKLTLAPGWKTYWRAPGDAGIPPQISWSKSKNLYSAGIVWPTPKVFYQSGMRSIGYERELILPVALKARSNGKPIKLHAELDIGVCSDICVPHHMTISAQINDANTKPTPAIAAALSSRPFSAKEAGVKSAHCALRPNAEGLEVEAQLKMPNTGGKEVVVIEPGQPGVWMSETDVSRKGSTLTATGDLVATGNGALAIDRSQIVITVFGKNQAVEIRGCPQG